VGGGRGYEDRHTAGKALRVYMIPWGAEGRTKKRGERECEAGTMKRDRVKKREKRKWNAKKRNVLYRGVERESRSDHSV
jgi:hypothetical protein